MGRPTRPRPRSGAGRWHYLKIGRQLILRFDCTEDIAVKAEKVASLGRRGLDPLLPAVDLRMGDLRRSAEELADEADIVTGKGVRFRPPVLDQSIAIMRERIMLA